MDADADMDLFVFGSLSVMGFELSLNLLCALHGVHDRREVHEKGIAHNLDDGAMMLTYRLLDEAIMDVQQPQHTGFVIAHLAARLKPTMSVNMIAASRRVSAGLVPALSSGMAAIIRQAPCGCQTVRA
jgi:hypothetical protein